MITDIHTHLNLICSIDDIPALIKKCKENGISSLFNISVDLNSNFISHQLSKKFDNIYFSVGIHPSEASKFKIKNFNKIEKLITDKKCIGIGEIGVDLYHTKENLKEQLELFEYQLHIAKKYNKPVILHTRDSFNETFTILNKNEFKDIRGVFHCFSYGIEEAKKIIERNFFISFAGNLTFKNAKNLHYVATHIPLEYILVETDSPYLTPMPYRGKKNYPYYIKFTIKFLSELKNMPINRVIEKLNYNINKLFF